MSAKVYEIAGALHKGTQQVLTDLQAMNVPVQKLSSVVSDEAMLALAESYGRREYILDIVSNQYIYELAKSWEEEELVKLFPNINWNKSFLSSKEAERLLILKECLPEIVEEVENLSVNVKNSKMDSAFYLVGNSKNAILIPKNLDLQIFLIPRDKKNVEPCCICFDKTKILHSYVNVKSCMLLVWADGKYFYEPAPFTKMQGKYYLELYKFLKERNIKLPKYGKINWCKKGFNGMTRQVLPGESGFASQEKRKCTVKIDGDKLLVCNGLVNTISWEAENAKMTIKGQREIKNAVKELLTKSGEINGKELEAFQSDLKKKFEETTKIPKIYVGK